MNPIKSTSVGNGNAVRPEPRSRPVTVMAAPSGVEAVSVASAKLATVAVAPSVDLSKAVEQIQNYLRESGKKLSVAFDDSADRYVTKVVNSDTGEVVRSIPSEEVLELARAINEKLGGIVDQRA